MAVDPQNRYSNKAVRTNYDIYVDVLSITTNDKEYQVGHIKNNFHPITGEIQILKK